MAENGQKQTKIKLFQTLTENSSKAFSDFSLGVSRDDSLPFCTNYMSRKIQFPELWWKMLSANQITWLLFQTLTENGSNNFSDFWLTVSMDDSLPFCTSYIFRKTLVLKLWPKKILANQIAQLLFQTLTKKDFKEFGVSCVILVETILNHSMQTECPGKFWLLSYNLKSSWPIISLDYLFRLWQRTAVRIFLFDVNRDDFLPSCTKCMQENSGSQVIASSCAMNG